MSLKQRYRKSWPEGLPFSLELNKDTLFNNLKYSAKKNPNQDAIIFYGNKITYSELFLDVKKIAGFLKKELNLSKGDRVGIIMQNCPQFIITYYAILGINCVVVPINPMLEVDEICFILKDADISSIFVASDKIKVVKDSLKKLKSNSIPIICVRYMDYIKNKFNIKLPDEFQKQSYKFSANYFQKEWSKILEIKDFQFSHSNNPDALCIIPYTSGSTGFPKGCKHTNRTVNSVIHSYLKWLPVPHQATILTTLPLFHVTGMQNSMNVPILNGNTIVLMTRWDTETALNLIKEYKVSSWRSITTSIIDVVNSFNSELHDISSLLSIGGGGASMPQKVALKLKKLTKLDYVEAYGLTETMAPTHINPPQKIKLGSIGIPLFNVDARILDIKTNKELGVNQVGELIISSPQLFLGYWNREDNSNYFVKFNEKLFFKTGDLAYYDSDGYFFVVDRLKRMINSAGFKIWPSEIEKILNNYEGIKEVCVIGVSDLRTGEKVKAVIVPEGSFSEDHFFDLKDWCSKHMAKYKIPKIFEIRESLPKNKMGKVLWRNLK